MSPLDEDVVEEAFAGVRVPGRLEVIGRHPLVVVDGAHNVAGMIVLARSLVEEFAVEGEMRAVVGMLSGRDPTAMLEALLTAGIRSVVACAPDSPRALAAEVVAEAAAGLGMEVAGGRHARGGGGAGPRPRRRRRPASWCAAPSTSWPTPSGSCGTALAEPHPAGGGPPRCLTPGATSASLPRSWNAHLSSASPTPSNAAWSGRSSAGSSARACAWWRPSSGRSPPRWPPSTTPSTTGKPFYDKLVAFITRSPAMVMVVEGPEDDLCQVVRNLMGATDPLKAARAPSGATWPSR